MKKSISIFSMMALITSVILFTSSNHVLLADEDDESENSNLQPFGFARIDDYLYKLEKGKLLEDSRKTPLLTSSANLNSIDTMELEVKNLGHQHFFLVISGSISGEPAHPVYSKMLIPPGFEGDLTISIGGSVHQALCFVKPNRALNVQGRFKIKSIKSQPILGEGQSLGHFVPIPSGK